jgi:hypothetical protein
MGTGCLSDAQLMVVAQTFHIILSDFIARYRERVGAWLVKRRTGQLGSGTDRGTPWPEHGQTAEPDPEEVQELENEDELDNVMMAEVRVGAGSRRRTALMRKSGRAADRHGARHL